MGPISFSDGLAIGGAILTIILVVLDKAGKLRGPALLCLLAVAACMAIPLLFSLSWVSGATSGMVMFTRRALVLFLLGSAWAGLSLWIETSDTQEKGETAHLAPTGSQSNPPKPDAKPPTLAELFTKDFPNTLKITDDGTGIRWKDGRVLHIKRQVYADFSANTKFVGFYIPERDPMASEDTFQACLILNHSNAVRDAINNAEKNVSVSGGYSDQVTSIHNLTFSGRVLIYHDANLSITQKADIIRSYSASHFELQFMGPEYLQNQLIAWHREHESKAQP